ncbi:hypothetical protein, partial [Rhodococcus sp. NPDC058514]|uniref:hypothetical protein n=1 Tax=Rhodococcus sp. NPDC058514 TaxID=3346532 RepID=UPI0036624081
MWAWCCCSVAGCSRSGTLSSSPDVDPLSNMCTSLPAPADRNQRTRYRIEDARVRPRVLNGGTVDASTPAVTAGSDGGATVLLGRLRNLAGQRLATVLPELEPILRAFKEFKVSDATRALNPAAI